MTTDGPWPNGILDFSIRKTSQKRIENARNDDSDVHYNAQEWSLICHFRVGFVWRATSPSSNAMTMKILKSKVTSEAG